MRAYGVNITTDGPATLLAIEGELDVSHGPELLDLILRTGVVQDHPHVTLEMSRVTFVDSSGIAALLEGHSRLDHEGIS